MSLMQTFRDGVSPNWRAFWRELWRLSLSVATFICLLSALVNYYHNQMQQAIFAAVAAIWFMLGEIVVLIKMTRS